MRSTVNTYPFQQGKIRSVTFAERLQAQLDAGKSKRQLAAWLGVSHTQIPRYLNGAQPTLAVASKMADVLGITLDELAGRSLDLKRKALVVSVDGELYVPVSATRAAQIAAAASRTGTGVPRPTPEDRADAAAAVSGLPAERRRGDRRRRPPHTNGAPGG